MSDVFVGVDPGEYRCGLSIVSADKAITSVYDSPLLGYILGMGLNDAGKFDTFTLTVEKPYGGNPSFGYTVGKIVGNLDCVCRSGAWGTYWFIEVGASTWRKAVLGHGNATKQDAIDYAESCGVDLSHCYREQQLKTKIKRIDEREHAAEAYCIAVYGKIMRGE